MPKVNSLFLYIIKGIHVTLHLNCPANSTQNTKRGGRD